MYTKVLRGESWFSFWITSPNDRKVKHTSAFYHKNLWITNSIQI